jgi:ribonuclease HI
MITNPDFIIYADGGSRGNPGKAAYGFVVYDGEKNELYKEGKYIGIDTNNVAEYSGVISALKYLLEKGDAQNSRIQFRLDSLLVASQLEGIYKVKNENLRNLFFTVKSLQEKLKATIHFQHVYRSENSAADAMVNKALDEL